MKYILLFFIVLTSAFANENLIGNPLSTHRLQTGDTCWAHTTFHLIESVAQKDSGPQFKGQLDSHFWFHVFRNRLRGRYLKKSSFVDSLQDKDIFSEKGFPQEALNVFKNDGINTEIKSLSSAYNQFDFRTQSTLRISDDQTNHYRSLSFKKFKPILDIENKDLAFEKIDEFLIKAGFKPTTNAQLKLEDKSIIRLNSESYNLNSFQKLDEFIWVRIQENNSTLDNKFSYLTTEFGFQILSHPLTLRLASELIRKSLTQNIPVPINLIDHSVLVLAMDDKYYYLIDSREKKIGKVLIKDLKYNVVHFSKSILDDHLVYP